MRTRVVAIAFLLTLGACAGSDSGGEKAEAPSEAGAVTVKDFAFGPKSVTVKVGSEVTWTNRDDFDHSVQIDSLDLSGPNFGPQTEPATYSYRFTKAGTYEYLCGVHNSMTGTVVVTN